jgi:hypothetical protein
MNSTDASNIRERVISFVKQKGPSLPVQIAKDVGLSILFTSAFLSELFSDKELKMSNMRVGSSPLYFIEGQEPMLERFAEHLKSKEREAFAILKDKKFLKDLEQLPAIRVALREIKDFAIPFRNGEEIVWRFLTVQETEFKDEKKPVVVVVEEVKIVAEQPKEEIKQQHVEVSVKEKKRPQKKERIVKTAKKKTSSKSKHDEKFIEKVKEFLGKNSIEIIHIEGIKKDELISKVKTNDGEQLLVAYKKKKITEKDIINAAKKAKNMGLKYSVISMGELPKKISELISALGNIKDIRKVE